MSQKESFIAQGLECGALLNEYPYIVDQNFIDASRASVRWSVIGQEEEQWEENAEQEPPKPQVGPKVSAFKSKFPTPPLHHRGGARSSLSTRVFPKVTVCRRALPVPPRPTQAEVEESVVVPAPKAPPVAKTSQAPTPRESEAVVVIDPAPEEPCQSSSWQCREFQQALTSEGVRAFGSSAVEPKYFFPSSSTGEYGVDQTVEAAFWA